MCVRRPVQARVDLSVPGRELCSGKRREGRGAETCCGTGIVYVVNSEVNLEEDRQQVLEGPTA